LYTAQKINSHYVLQPYTNQSVFKSLLNCTSEISLSCNATWQRVPETRSGDGKTPILFVAHVKTSPNRSDRQPMSVKS